MALTLWRGSTLLGELHERSPSTLRVWALHGPHPTLSAVLLPRADAPLEGVWQFRHSLSRRAPVFQHAVPPDIVSERHRPRARDRSASWAVAPTPMPPEQRQGVPREQQFRVVSDAGAEIPIRSVQVMESRYEEKDVAVPLREVPPAALVNGSVWTVSVLFTRQLRKVRLAEVLAGLRLSLKGELSARSTHSARGPGDRLSPEEAALAHRPFSELTEAELRRWCQACLRLSRLDPSLLARWWWRRRWRRAMGAGARRIAGRVGFGPPLCERCGTQRPTVHVVYGHGADQRTRHFCAKCSELEPPGWFVRAEAGS